MTARQYLLYAFWMLVILSQAALCFIVGTWPTHTVPTYAVPVFPVGVAVLALAGIGFALIVTGKARLVWYNVLPLAAPLAGTALVLLDRGRVSLILWAMFLSLVIAVMLLVLLVITLGPESAANRRRTGS